MKQTQFAPTQVLDDLPVLVWLCCKAKEAAWWLRRQGEAQIEKQMETEKMERETQEATIMNSSFLSLNGSAEKRKRWPGGRS